MLAPVDRDKQIQISSKANQPLGGQGEISLTNLSLYLGGKSWQRSLLVQSIGWLSSLGILSSGIVWAQTQAPQRAVVSATVPPVLPKAAAIDPPPVTVRTARRRGIYRDASLLLPSARRRNPVRSTAQIVVQSPPKGIDAPRANLNSYIDPTDYSVGATRSYTPPSSVVLSTRSRGCQKVSRGRGMAGCGSAVARTRTQTRTNVALGNANTSRRALRSDSISRLPRNVQIDRSFRSDSISRLPRNVQIDRSSRQMLNLRIPRQAQIEYIPDQNQPFINTAQPSRLSRRSQIAWKPRPRVLSNSAKMESPSIKIGSVSISNNGIRIRRKSVISSRMALRRQNEMSSPVGLNNGTDGMLPSPGGYYYNQTPRPDGMPSNGNIALIFPLSMPAEITSVFGWRIHPISGDRRFHSGTDLGAPAGTPVVAAYAGRVALADFLGGYGLTVILRHNQDAEETRYAHLSEIFVQAGEWVNQGTVIGRVGSTGNSTGPHLHFEIREQTPEGWVTADAGNQLGYALAQMVRTLQVAQLPKDLKSSLNLGNVPPLPPLNAQLPEVVVRGTPPYLAQFPAVKMPPLPPTNTPLPEIVVPKAPPLQAQLPPSMPVTVQPPQVTLPPSPSTTIQPPQVTPSPMSSSKNPLPQAMLPQFPSLSSQLPELRLFKFLSLRSQLFQFNLPELEPFKTPLSPKS